MQVCIIKSVIISGLFIAWLLGRLWKEWTASVVVWPDFG